MKVKGRRQSSNVVDLRDPRKQAAHNLRKFYEHPEHSIGDAIMDSMSTKMIQDTFREDQIGMEMLLGPRWKD